MGRDTPFLVIIEVLPFLDYSKIDESAVIWVEAPVSKNQSVASGPTIEQDVSKASTR